MSGEVGGSGEVGTAGGSAGAGSHAHASPTSPGRGAFDAVILAGGRGSRLGGIDKAAVELEGARLLDRVVAAARRSGAERVVVVGPEREPAEGPADSGASVRASRREGDAEPSAAVPGFAAPDAVVREDPPFGGPLPALAAGLAEVRAEWLLLLPCDLERPDELCAHLLTAWAGSRATGGAGRCGEGTGDETARDEAAGSAGDPEAPAPAPVPDPAAADGVRLVDEGGRPQWLAGVYRAEALRRAIAAATGTLGDPEPDPADARADRNAAPAAAVGETLAGLPLRIAFAGARIAEVPAPGAVVADIDTPDDLADARARSRAQSRAGTRD